MAQASFIVSRCRVSCFFVCELRINIIACMRRDRVILFSLEIGFFYLEMILRNNQLFGYQEFTVIRVVCLGKLQSTHEARKVSGFAEFEYVLLTLYPPFLKKTKPFNPFKIPTYLHDAFAFHLNF